MNAQVWFLSAVLVLAGCGKKQETAKAPAAGQNPLSAPADYLGAVNQAKKVAVKKVDVASLQNAIGLFHAQEDRYPKDLNELVQQRYIGQVPVAPAGTRLEYNPVTGEVRFLKQ